MRKRQEIRRIAASIMAAVMMVTAIPFGGTAYGNEVPRGGIVNTEDTETLTASDSNGEYKKISRRRRRKLRKKRNRLRCLLRMVSKELELKRIHLLLTVRLIGSQ